MSFINEGTCVCSMVSRKFGLRSILLVTLMLAWSGSPLVELDAKAHPSAVTEWGSGGHNDTGWMTIDATGADSLSGIQATGDLHLTLAPGAEVSNVSFEVRVNGSNGTWVEQPQLSFVDTQYSIMDWRGMGGFGQQNDLMSGEPYSSRLQPTVNTGASWMLPSDAEISDMVIEALRPADAYVTFEPFTFVVKDSEQHLDGRLYLLVEDVVLQLDANNDPPLIEIHEGVNGSTTMAVDLANDLLLVALENGSFRAFSLSDSSEVVAPYPSLGSGYATSMMFDSSNVLWVGTDTAELFAWDHTGASLSVATNPSSGSDKVTCLQLVGSGELLVGTAGGGVMRYDSIQDTWLNSWDSQNALPSDVVVDMEVANGILLIGLWDAGIVRRNVATGSWLATWTSSNWLDSDDVRKMEVTGNWLNILAGDTMHYYNMSMGAFSTNVALSDYGLIRGGMDIIQWQAIGSRSPSTDSILVSDGSGEFALVQSSSPPTWISNMLLSTSPSSSEMYDVVEVSNKVFVAGNDVVDVFDKQANRWITPIFTGSTNVNLETDGASLWVATLDAGLFEFALNGTQTNHWDISDNLNSDSVDSLAYDQQTDTLLLGHSDAGMTVLDVNSSNVTSSWSASRSDVFSNQVRGVAARSGTAYVASNQGVIRLDIANDTLLSSWRSTGMDDVSYMPVETDGSRIYVGLYGYGVLVFDRVSGDVLETWRASRGNNGILNNNIYSLHIDSNNDIWVGTADGASRWDGNSWSHIQAQGGFNPANFYDLTSDTNYLYAGTNAGACQYELSSLNREDCWNYYSNPEGLPSSWVYSVEMLSNGLLYAGTNYGAGVIDVVNDTVIDVWEAGEQTWSASTYLYDDVVYVGLNGVGVGRFDLTAGEWLATWDTSSQNNIVTDNDVTTLIPDRQAHRIWIGGDFGVRLIDLDNQSYVDGFSRTGGQDPPAELVIIGNTLYASEERGNGGSNDNIYRYDIDTMSSLSTLDAGAQISQSGSVYGIGEGPDGMLWIGVTPSSWWGLDAGSIVRYDHANGTWGAALEATGTILRVNSAYAGECEPLNISMCHVFASYGEKVHRHFDYYGNLLNEWDDSVMQGPIRSIDYYQGIVHFATYDGIARYDMVNDTWLNTWTPGSGLPSQSEDTIYDIEVVGDDLWYTTMANSGWSRNSRIFRMNGTTGVWSSWEAGQGSIPGGFGFSMEVCRGVLHVAMARWSGWGSQGGVARYDLSSSQWLSQWTQGGGGTGNNGLADDDAIALACDEQGGVVFVGFEQNDVGISRYQYGQGAGRGFLSTISETANGISGDVLFPDGMRWHGGVLMASHTDENGIGGISRISSSGSALGSGVVLDAGTQASSMEIVPSTSSSVQWLVGRPGGDSGYNRVDILNSTGLHTFDVLAGLSSGRMLDVTFQGNNVWITCADDSSQYFGSSILHGSLTTNGSIQWNQAYPFVWDVVNEMLPINNDLWVTTAGGGLYKVDTTTGQIQWTSLPLHLQMHGIHRSGDQLVIGLMGTTSTAAGFQIYNMTTTSWTDGSLLAGLPSNLVRDFVEYDNKVWIATYGGLGVWNLSTDSWDDPITTQDGLPTPVIEHIWVEGSELMLGTPSGLTRFETTNMTVVDVIDRNDGLIGTRVSGIAYAAQTTVTSGGNSVTYPRSLMLSHNGEGPTRPGATSFDISTMTATQVYMVDMLPSNDVTAVAADWWGVHVATTEEPLMHWNAGSNTMEAGSPSWAFMSWPIESLASDGTTLLATTQIGIDFVSVQNSIHGITRSEAIVDTTSSWIGSTGIWLTTDGSGLYGWGSSPSFLELERQSMRRADPLTATFVGSNWDLTNTSKPGMATVLVDSSSPVMTPAPAGNFAPSGIGVHQLSLTLSSQVDGAAIWVTSNSLNYSGIWNLTDVNSNLEAAFELASRRGTLTPEGRDMHIQLTSPLNGSLEVRITYDWVRSESPVEIIDLYDRPDDGGGVLVSEWTPSQDHGWAAYRIYLNVGNWSSQPTSADLLTRNFDARIPDWSTTMVDINTVNGQPIQDGVDIYGVAVVEYSDGTLGEPSDILGPAASSDEIPSPPEWANAGPAEGGEDGDLYVEWAKCTAIDHAGTRIWVSTQEINDAVGLSPQGADQNTQSNSTVLELERGRPYWVALTCVDEGGQHDPANATIVGPVVPVGGINDGIPPVPVEDIDAYDTPDDQGGRITVDWTPNSEDDCGWHLILVKESQGELESPTSAFDFENATIVPDCTTNSTVISSFGDQRIVDNTLYWITVVAFDFWGNGDLGNVTSIQAFSEKNQRGADPPERVVDLAAWDHPDDDGTRVDVMFGASEAEDFGYYVVWASSQPTDDMAATWARCKDDLAACGAVKIDIQQPFGADDGKIELTLTQALYDGDSVENSNPDMIRPNTPLSVTVTVHDIYDSAFLTGLPTVVVTPIDNRDDITPPDRLDAPTVADIPGDNGKAVSVDFARSEASDLAYYEVYADIVAFTSIGHRQPLMVVDRDFQGAFTLEVYEGDTPIMSGIPVHVAIVPVDSAGNFHDDRLNVGKGRAIDNSGEDPGGHLPDVDFTTAWNEDGTGIEVDWEALTSTDVRSYRIYVSTQRFENTDEADLAKEGIIGTFWTLEEYNETDAFDNSSHWFIGVVTYDGSVWKHSIQSKELKPYKAPGSDGDGDDDDGQSSTGILDLIDLNTMLTILLSLAILTVLLMAFRARRNRRQDEAWQLANSAWGLPQENWGDEGFDSDVDLAGTLMPAAAAIQSDQKPVAEVPAASVAQQPVQSYEAPPTDASRRLAELSNELFDEPASRPSSGDSELDSLIDDLL